MQTIRKFAFGHWYECKPAENGVWYIHWTDGRRSKRQTTRQKNVSGAQAFFDQWLTLLRSEAVFNAVPTIEDLWLAKYGPATSRVTAAWKHLQPVFGHLRPAEVTPELEISYAASRGIAQSTLRLELSLLRSVWNHAVKARLLNLEDTPVLPPLPEPSAPRERVLTDDEITRLFAAAEPGSRVWRFMWLACETAARRTAIQDLTWDQVDFRVGVLDYLVPGTRQSRKRRASVPISSRLRPVLENLHATATSRLVIGPGARINEPLRLVAQRAGVAGVTPHVFRHTAATRMAQDSVALWIIAKILGNTVEQVENVYAKWQPQAHQSAVDSIGKRRAA